MSQFICTKCQKEYPIDTISYRCECGGIFRLQSSAPKFNPGLIDKDEFSIFRYRQFMAVDTKSYQDITMGEGLASSVKFRDGLYLKLDYVMPTLSFKDRGAAVLMQHIKNLGIKKAIQDSSGNAGSSVVAYAARVGVECEIFVPKKHKS
ncbi:MAG: pyridoxal-phosphate dependent enzyme [Campylobacter sp.]|nr:pyridoxal-phosphate dependent enzyme [Campylobacter sp.]